MVKRGFRIDLRITSRVLFTIPFNYTLYLHQNEQPYIISGEGWSHEITEESDDCRSRATGRLSKRKAVHFLGAPSARAQPSNTGDRPEWGDGRPSGLANDLRLLPVFDPTPAAENGGAYPGGHGRAGIQPGEHRGSHSGKSHFIGGNSNNVI